jgi:tubulin epsilon
MQHADCTFPIDNQALLNICEKLQPSKKNTNLMVQERKNAKPFDQMNGIVAQMLTQLTCSMRFEGQLNIDLNEITTNLVPYPKMKYLISSLSPLYMANDLKLRR